MAGPTNRGRPELPRPFRYSRWLEQTNPLAEWARSESVAPRAVHVSNGAGRAIRIDYWSLSYCWADQTRLGQRALFPPYETVVHPAKYAKPGGETELQLAAGAATLGMRIEARNGGALTYEERERIVLTPRWR